MRKVAYAASVVSLLTVFVGGCGSAMDTEEAAQESASTALTDVDNCGAGCKFRYSRPQFLWRSDQGDTAIWYLDPIIPGRVADTKVVRPASGAPDPSWKLVGGGILDTRGDYGASWMWQQLGANGNANVIWNVRTFGTTGEVERLNGGPYQPSSGATLVGWARWSHLPGDAGPVAINPDRTIDLWGGGVSPTSPNATPVFEFYKHRLPINLPDGWNIVGAWSMLQPNPNSGVDSDADLIFFNGTNPAVWLLKDVGTSVTGTLIYDSAGQPMAAPGWQLLGGISWPGGANGDDPGLLWFNPTSRALVVWHVRAGLDNKVHYLGYAVLTSADGSQRFAPAGWTPIGNYGSGSFFSTSRSSASRVLVERRLNVAVQ